MREPAERVVGYSRKSDTGPMGGVRNVVDELMERVVVVVDAVDRWKMREEVEQMRMAMRSEEEMVDVVDAVVGVAVVVVGAVVEVVVGRSSSAMVISDL